MKEETETWKTSRHDPCESSDRRASENTQDISHVFAGIFKDLYTREITNKDTLLSLSQSTKESSSYHERYVKELQQAHAEYSRCTEEADKLESHILQARARAADTESKASERIREELGEYHDHLTLFTVESAFSSCVDNNLLEMNNLICPQDYLPTQEPPVEAPAPIKSNPAKPSPKKAGLETNESDISLTLESSSNSQERSKTPRLKPIQAKHRPKLKDKLNAEDQDQELEKLQKLKQRHNFLRNPRFLPPLAQQGGKPGKTECAGRGKEEKGNSSSDHFPVFLATPSVVVFTEYSVGHVYETTLELKNMTSKSCRLRLIPPTTPYFSIGLGRFPSDGGIVAPGMSCKYTVRFAPDSLGDFEDFIMVETQAERVLVVPIAASRPPPVLTLPRVLDCGYCLIGGVKFVKFLCQNVGLSTGTFCILPKSQWPTTNLRSAERSFFSEQPPFAISPSVFVLRPGEAAVVEVVFFPTVAEKCSQVFTVVCDNCQVKDISIEGEGQLVALELVSVSGRREPPVVGELHDLTAEHFIRFSPCNPHSWQEKKVIIKNNVHLELLYHWQIMKPNLRPLLPGEFPEPSHIRFHPATDEVFQIRPMSGVLSPCQEEEFLFTFCPKKLEDYHRVCHLVLSDVPELPQKLSEDSSILPAVHTGSKATDVIVMEIEVKGTTEPYQVLLDPYAVIIPGEVFICTTTRRQFKMWNHSKSCIFFHWERMSSSSHIIEVEPPAGRIEENECFDFDLIVTGGKPERVVTGLVCHIEHHEEPVTLAIEVSFKGPIVTISVPCVDFGLMQLGEQTQSTLLLTNSTHLEANWMLKEKQESQRETHMFVEPCSGVLPPFVSCSVEVRFMPRFCQRYETELELTVENGTGCHVSVRAEVQSPQVCLLSCELLLSELYIGVPAKANVTLFNQTLLPTNFSWKAQLQGEQAELCTAVFEPSSGTLGPNASIVITVTFATHTDLEVTELVALCKVQAMSSPLVLSIVATKTKKLSVSYSLPSLSSTDAESPSVMLLNFGDDVVVKKAVTKQFIITNQTAIAAPFSLEAEYFCCHSSDQSIQKEKRYTFAKKPLHSNQAKELEEKAHEEFVSSLLAHGKGAAFFVLPHSGMLGPFESLTVDVTAYTEMWGEYRDQLICKVGDLEPTLIPMQMTVKGCPLYFKITGPQLNDQTQGPIIQFGSHVSGGDTISRSLRIVNSTWFDQKMDIVIENKHKLVGFEEEPLLNVAEKDEVSSGSLENPDEDKETDWEKTLEETSSPILSVSDKKEVEYIYENHCEEEDACNPYCITPQIVIPAKSSSTIHVSFTPLTLSGSVRESRCLGLALGFLGLETEAAACVPGKVTRAQGLDLEPISMELHAVVKTAMLLVQTEENEEVLDFRVSAGDLLTLGKSEEEVVFRDFDSAQTVLLKNDLEMPLQFTLETQPPFSVLKPQPQVRNSISSYPPTREGQALVLTPGHSMQVKVAFHCSPSLLDHADQLDEEVPDGVELVTSKSGQMKLKFQKNLQIHYSNNSLQTVPLCAHLDLVSLHLSSDSVNLGLCYVGQTQTAKVNLYSYGSDTYWKLVIESDVFSVTPGFGFLKSRKNISSCSQISLQISFTPSEDREFRASVEIWSPLVKMPLTLQLQGSGSFEEVYRLN